MLRPGSLQPTPPLRPASFPASSRARWHAVDSASITPPAWHKYLQRAQTKRSRVCPTPGALAKDLLAVESRIC